MCFEMQGFYYNGDVASFQWAFHPAEWMKNTGYDDVRKLLPNAQEFFSLFFIGFKINIFYNYI